MFSNRIQRPHRQDRPLSKEQSQLPQVQQVRLLLQALTYVKRCLYYREFCRQAEVSIRV